MVKNIILELHALEFVKNQLGYNYQGDLINLENKIQKYQKNIRKKKMQIYFYKW
jgi:hypothetical protein